MDDLHLDVDNETLNWVQVELDELGYLAAVVSSKVRSIGWVCFSWDVICINISSFR